MLPNVCFRVFENRLFIRPTHIESSVLVGCAEDSRERPLLRRIALGRPLFPARVSASFPSRVRCVSAARRRSSLLQKPPFCKSIRHRTTRPKRPKSPVSREVLRKILYGKAPNEYRIRSKVAQSLRCFGDSGSMRDVRHRRSSLEWISPVFFSKMGRDPRSDA